VRRIAGGFALSDEPRLPPDSVVPAATAPGAGGLLRLAALIDRVNAAIGRAVSWLTVALVLLAAGNALLRWAGRLLGRQLSSNLWLELQWYLFSVLFLLAIAWVMERDGHVRVDALATRLAPRTRRWIDLAGHLLLLFPFTLLLLWACWPSVRASWLVREGSPDPGGLPRYPLKAMVLLALLLVVLQGVSLVIKDAAALRRRATPGEAHDSLRAAT
jgi:TRAP-type mannitol/chloroaromatic compound transport system permease small subunit